MPCHWLLLGQGTNQKPHEHVSLPQTWHCGREVSHFLYAAEPHLKIPALPAAACCCWSKSIPNLKRPKSSLPADIVHGPQVGDVLLAAEVGIDVSVLILQVGQQEHEEVVNDKGLIALADSIKVVVLTLQAQGR